MPQRPHLTHRTVELWLTGARTVLAISVALALVLSDQLHLQSLVGTLGMYAATDGVIAALSRRRTTLRAAWAEGVLGTLLGIVIMVWTDTSRGLLVLFCVRTMLVAVVELLVARAMSGPGWLTPRAPGAMLAYAALSAIVLSLALSLMAPAGYGALDLYACLAGQLTIWASLIAAHTVRLRRRNASASADANANANAEDARNGRRVPPAGSSAPRPRRRVSWT